MLRDAKFRSVALWTSISSLALLTFKDLGVLSYLGLSLDKCNILLDSIFSSLILLGILSESEPKRNY